MNSYHHDDGDDNDNDNGNHSIGHGNISHRLSHSRSDPGREERRHGSYRNYSASVVGATVANKNKNKTSSKFTFNPREYGGEARFRSPTVGGGYDTHSLIQRAARSALMDDVTPTGSTIFSSGDASDEEEEDYPNNANANASESTRRGGGGGQQQQRPPLPNIRSLEKPSLPAIPDEQDRKRFVGCLAAVLSSMYDYESYELKSEKGSSSNNQNENESETENENENDVSGFFDFYESSDDEESIGISSSTRNKKKDNMTEARNNTINTKASLLSPTPSTDTTENFYSRRCKSFESLSSTTSSTMTGTTTTTSSTTNNTQNRNLSKKQPLPPSSKLKPMASFRRQAANVQKMNSNTHKNNKNIADEKTRLSRQRYLSRRYELYSGLLLSSAELLLLDKSISRAFLPMLSRVLVPQIHKTQNSTTDTSNYNTMNKARTKQEETQQSSRTSVSKSDIEIIEGEEDPPIRIFRSPDLHLLDNVDELSPFLDSLTPGSGFRCVSLLLLQHVLTSENGYDSRIRHAVKKLSVLVLRRHMDDDPVERELSRQPDRVALNGYAESADGNETEKDSSRDYERMRLHQATRKFEALERNIARRLILLSTPVRNRKSKTNSNDSMTRKTNPSDNAFITREQLIRGVKIGGAGILAGTLFALTGPLAAPGIAAGVAAVAGAAAGTAAVSALTSAAVVTTIFGVGGGGLAAYKMQRRTQGLTEFEFCRETKGRPDRRGSRNPESSAGNEDQIEAELFSVLCISGWLRDQCDYQRPWGLQPTHPRITDRLEKLERFYSVHSPDHVPKCERILNSWKGEEDKLWEILRQKYGRDPDHLFPLCDVDQKNGIQGGNIDGHGALTLDQEEILDKLFVELGYHSVAPEQEAAMHHHHDKPMSPFEKMRNGWKNRRNNMKPGSMRNITDDKCDSMHGPSPYQKLTKNPSATSNNMQYVYESQAAAEEPSFQQKDEGTEYEPPKHLATVWDWKTTYGGEMYTVKWESILLTQMCDCVTDLAVDVVTGATRQILKQTVLHTLLVAVVLPSYLLNLMDAIDGDWTLAVERADEAGIVLAKTLLYSRAGRRPVTLVGYSFGARIIYSCLKELARYQEEWEHYRELLEENDVSGDGGNHHEHARLAKYKQKMKGMREPSSIVEDAILLGLPNHLSLSSWKACRQIVAGRMVNCYSSNDLILSLMFQAKRFSGGSLNQGMGSILKPVCGACPVEEPGVENIDCSDLILGHQDYCLETGKILERIGLGEPIRFVGEPRVNGGVAISTSAKP
jgi:hypothetical protein